MAKKRNTKRADGRIAVQVYLGRDENNKRLYKTVYGKTQKEADEKALQIKVAMKKGLDVTAERNTGMPGLSFSWRRALGITKAKRRIAKFTGIPTTRSGRRAKAGRLMGCATYLFIAFAAMGVMIAGIIAII